MANFKRQYELTISRPPSINTEPQIITPDAGTSRVVNKDGDYRTVDKLESIVITDLDIQASVSTSKKMGSNTPFNLTMQGFNSNTEGFVEKNSVVILKAGYENTQMSILFVGQVNDKTVDFSTEIPVMRLSCSDGYTPSSAVKITKEFPADPSTTYETVLQYLADIYADNGVPLGRGLTDLQDKLGVGVGNSIDKIRLTKGYVISGMFLDKALSKVCKEVGYTYYFNKSKLFIEPENYQNTLVDEFKILPNQIISIAKIIPTNSMNSKDTQEKTSGYRLKLLLDGRIDVGDFISTEINESVRGVFKVVDVKHDLHFEGDSWFTTIEVQDVE